MSSQLSTITLGRIEWRKPEARTPCEHYMDRPGMCGHFADWQLEYPDNAPGVTLDLCDTHARMICADVGIERPT